MEAYEDTVRGAGLDAAWLHDALVDLRLEELDPAQVAILQSAGAKIRRAAGDLASARHMIASDVVGAPRAPGPSETKEEV